LSDDLLCQFSSNRRTGLFHQPFQASDAWPNNLFLKKVIQQRGEQDASMIVSFGLSPQLL
jgi:hypothetical protein